MQESKFGQGSALHLHLKEKERSFAIADVHVLDREKTGGEREE